MFCASAFNFAVSGCWACAYAGIAENTKIATISTKFMKEPLGFAWWPATSMPVAGLFATLIIVLFGWHWDQFDCWVSLLLNPF